MTVVLLTVLLPPLGYGQQPLPETNSRFIVIGDAGKLRDGKNILVDVVSNYVSTTDSITTILFLGDNIYPKGLPDEEDKTFSSSLAVLKGTLTPFKSHRAKVYMIPGNHDWENGGPNGWQNVKRQGQHVKELNQTNIFFLPEGGCPGPEEIIINNDLVLIIVDTQWWLHVNDKAGIMDDCECKTEEELLTRLHDIVYRNRGKKILFATHHPFRSHGVHGGYFTWKQHIFPLTDLSENAYLPLPGIGSLYPLIRGKFGNIEDLRHPLYKDMIRGIEKATSNATEVTFVAGHDHNLQFINEHNRKYVVSGSGTNRGRVKAGEGSLFASDENGFAEIIYTSDGGQTIRYYAVDEKGEIKLLFTYQAPLTTNPNDIVLSPERKTFPDSIVVKIAPQYNEVSKVHRKIWGEHNRKIWDTPVRLGVLHLDEQYGGLTILKKGGGQQTKSLRMQDKSGKEWVLRTIQKNPELALPANLKATVAKTIVQDQISAANPFAPLTVPTLAGSIGVPHADPKILFVPDDPAFGIYRSEFANTVCILEEREPGAEETISTLKLQEKLQDDNDNRVDQKAVLRARMLDVLIGDWDRHGDQWRWRKEKVKSKNIYSPIPRDRDQVFFVNTGIVPFIASRKWITPKFQGFSNSIHDVNGFMFNGRYFDRSFLNELDKDDWEEVISEIQLAVTDDVIRQSIRQLPDTIFKTMGDQLIKDLIARRNDLMTNGLIYYSFLSKAIDVPASDKKERFSISTKLNGDATIILQKIRKDDSRGDTIYQRTINNEDTQEVRLYGQGGQDVFVVEGNYKPGFKIRMIGGDAIDSFYVDSRTAVGRRLFIYDRSDKKNKYPQYKVALRTSEDGDVNEYDSRAFKYNKLFPLASIGFNLDDGIQLAAGGIYTKHEFRRDPFAARHRLLVGKSLATNAFFIQYKGDITHAIGKTDLDLDLNVAAPNNTSNFFGIGNETTSAKLDDIGIRYYRTRYDLINAQMRFKRRFMRSINVFAGPAVQFVNLNADNNKGRFFNEEYVPAQNDSSAFSNMTFVGGVVGYEIDTRDNILLPVHGVHWRTTFTGMQQLNNPSDRYGQVRTEMSIYLSFNRHPKLVIANRVGGGISFGNPQFFQMFYLGGEGLLQGYRKFRFAGTSMFYDNFELRIKLFDFASYLFPGSVGLIGFNDVGRVWISTEESHKWHWGYGGGFYVIPAGTLAISGVAGFSEEGVLPYITMRFRF